MIQNIQKQLADARAKVAALESEIQNSLRALPAQFGFSNLGELVAALTALSPTPAKAAAPAVATKATPVPGKKRRRTRAVITDQTRATVKALAEGGKTAKQIASATGISTASVATIKKKFGLVGKGARARAKRSSGKK